MKRLRYMPQEEKTQTISMTEVEKLVKELQTGFEVAEKPQCRKGPAKALSSAVVHAGTFTTTASAFSPEGEKIKEVPVNIPVQVTVRRKSTVVGDTVLARENVKPMRMSLDNMLDASHVLSIKLNGRKYDPGQYSSVVQKYVARVVKAGTVEQSLQELNNQIVCRIGKEASK